MSGTCLSVSTGFTYVDRIKDQVQGKRAEIDHKSGPMVNITVRKPRTLKGNQKQLIIGELNSDYVEVKLIDKNGESEWMSIYPLSWVAFHRHAELL